MKIKILVALLLIITAAGYYIYQDPQHRARFLENAHKVIPEINETTLYKWKDKSGNWQITDRPPADGVPYTTVSSQDQVNVMPSKQEK